MCQADPVLARLRRAAPGFRPALFYSPYEAAVWSVISARRARSQGITLRSRLSQAYGASFELAGQQTLALPTPTQLLGVDSLQGLPMDRIPRCKRLTGGTRGQAVGAAADGDVAEDALDLALRHQAFYNA
jgi:DNA-3-methyladenine glycosylase II